MLVSPYNISSVLTENIGVDPKTGKAFSFTWNEKEAKNNPNLIFIKTENDMAVPQFTEDQKKAASSFMKGQIEQMIKYDSKINPYAEPRPERPTEYEYKRGDELKDQQNAVSAWNSVFTEKDPERKRLAVETLVGTQKAQKSGLIDIDFDAQAVDKDGKPVPGKKGISFVYTDPVKNRTVPYDPSVTKLQDWSRIGNEVHGVDNIQTAMKYSGGGNPNLIMGREYSNFGGVRAKRQGPTAEVGGLTPQQKADLMKLNAAKQAKDLGYKYDWATGTVIAE